MESSEVNPSHNGSRFDKGKTLTHQLDRTQKGDRFLKQSQGWQPTCECHGKLVRKTVTIQPRISGEAAEQWGADSNGEYNGESQKEHPEGIQDASALKKRIIDNATNPRTVSRIVYESDMPLDQHKTVPCVVLDPFGGSGTVGQVSLENGRSAVLIELNPDYLPLIHNRTLVTPAMI